MNMTSVTRQVLHEMTSVTRACNMLLQEHNKCYINMTSVIRIWMREDNHFLFKGQQVICREIKEDIVKIIWREAQTTW